MSDLLTQLEDALQATVKFGSRHLAAPIWEPAAKSEAATEFANGETRQSGDPWGEDPARTTYALASLLMTGVLDNLGSIWRLLGDPMPVLGPTVITRSALEMGATAWWLTEPGIGVRRRVCRELVRSLASARRGAQVAVELDDPIGQAEALAQEGNVLKRIDDLAIGAPSGPKFRPVLEGESFPDATKLTAAMLKPLLPAGNPGESFYRSYSAVTHGEVYGLMNFMTPVPQPDGKDLLVWQLPGPVLDSTSQMAICAFRQPFERIRKVMGWGVIEKDLWLQKLHKIFNPPTK
jgi:hypothetical protein